MSDTSEHSSPPPTPEVHAAEPGAPPVPAPSSTSWFSGAAAPPPTPEATFHFKKAGTGLRNEKGKNAVRDGQEGVGGGEEEASTSMDVDRGGEGGTTGGGGQGKERETEDGNAPKAKLSGPASFAAKFRNNNAPTGTTTTTSGGGALNNPFGTTPRPLSSASTTSPNSSNLRLFSTSDAARHSTVPMDNRARGGPTTTTSSGAPLPFGSKPPPANQPQTTSSSTKSKTVTTPRVISKRPLPASTTSSTTGQQAQRTSSRDSTSGETGGKRRKVVQDGGVGVGSGMMGEKQRGAGGKATSVAMDAIMSLGNDVEVRDSQINSLQSQLKEKTYALDKLTKEKDKFKQDMLARLKTALSSVDTAKKGLDETTQGMRSVTNRIERESGGTVKAAEIKQEIETIRLDISTRLDDSSYAASVDEHERTMLSVLREVKSELDSSNLTLEILRRDLETKAGELVEARDRIGTLERDQVDVEDVRRDSQKKIKDVEDLYERSLKREKELKKEVDEGLLRGALREEKERVAVEEVRRYKGLEGEWEGEKRKLVVDCEEAKRREEVERSQNAESLAKLNEQHQLEIDSLQRAKERLESQLKQVDETLANVRRQEEHAREELRLAQIKLGEQSTVQQKLEDAQVELTSLRPFATQLRKAQDDLSVATHERDNARSAARSDSEVAKKEIESLQHSLKTSQEREKAGMAREKAATAQSDEKDRKLVESERKSQELVERLAQAAKREQNLIATEASLKRQLDEAHRSQAQVNTSIAQTDTSRSEVDTALISKNDELTATIEAQRAIEQQVQRAHDETTAALEVKVNELITEKQLLDHELQSFKAQLVSQSTDLTALQTELDRARAEDKTLRSKLAKAEKDQESIKQSTAAATMKSCQETADRKMADTKNELKRTHNKLEEVTTRLQKTLTELAKAKGRPVIASSSGSEQPTGHDEFESQDLQPEEQPGKADSSSSLSEIGAMADEDETAVDIQQAVTANIKHADFAIVVPSHQEPEPMDDIVSSTAPIPAAVPLKSTTKGKAKGVGDGSSTAATTTTVKSGRKSSRTLSTSNRKLLPTDDDIEEVPVEETVPHERVKAKGGKAVYGSRKRGK